MIYIVIVIYLGNLNEYVLHLIVLYSIVYFLICMQQNCLFMMIMSNVFISVQNIYSVKI